MAVVGCGAWGTNLVRTLSALGALRAVVDADASAADAAAGATGVPALSLEAVLDDPSIDAVVVATPAVHHFSIARASLDAGKHVFVEKPLALDVEQATELCDRAEMRGLVLMVGHLLRYHPAFVELSRIMAGGGLGRIRYLYSNRLNLGRFRQEEDILWSFAPHDVSMILALVGAEPERVSATGDAYVDHRVADVTLTDLWFPRGERAHVFVSWLHPFKEQKLVVVGDQAMAVFDDGEPWPSKLRLFRHDIAWDNGVPQAVRADGEAVPVPHREPLEVECRHFLDCIVSGATPETDGREGVRVLRVLAAAGRSVRAHQASVHDVSGRVSMPGVMVHETAYIDEPCEIGVGTQIWHFSHVLADSTIGRNCTIGQNVMIGPRAVVGDDCKIQNNVSVYEGVTLEAGVFCGPSCVFTNVTNPRAEVDRRREFLATRVGRGATIGANATIVCGNTIGAWSFVAAGAVVTADVAPHALVAGVPARRIGWVSHDGERLGDDLVCPRSGRRYVLAGPERLEESRPEDEAPTPIVLVDLPAQRRRIGSRLDEALAAVLDHGQFVMGPEVGRLEVQLSASCGARHSITCASGTDALVLGLLAEGVGPGDAVVVPAFTFAATAEAVALVGATPVFADVRPDTFTLDPVSLEAALAQADSDDVRVAGVIPVDLFGHPADYRSICEIAAGRNLWVMADAAQSFGAQVDGRRVGSLARLTATSFFPAKPLGCYGDGGAVFTDDDHLADRLRALRVHGKVEGEHRLVGLNGRLDTLQAAVLIEKLAIFDDELAARRLLAAHYGKSLADVVDVPAVSSGVEPAWACYTLRTSERDKLAARLQDRGIASAIYYDRPLHQHPAYRQCRVAPGGTPVADRLAGEVLSIPVHPYLDRAARDRIVEAVREATT